MKNCIQKATPVDERFFDVERTPSTWPWGAQTSANLDQDVPVDVTHFVDAAVGVGMGRAERFTIVLKTLQWSLHRAHQRPLEPTTVEALADLALTRGRSGWDAAMRCVHKLNRRIWDARLIQETGHIRRPSEWMDGAIRDALPTVRDELRQQEQTAKKLRPLAPYHVSRHYGFLFPQTRNNADSRTNKKVH